MGLTRPRAHQLQDMDFKQTARAITSSNITLSGGAPATVDGVSLLAEDRVLVNGQTDQTENGIYYVTTLGSGSNGTWTRTSDANATGEMNSGMIIMITEGTAFADTQWMLTTDGTITIGSTNITFAQASSNSFGIVAVAGQDNLAADSVGDTLTIVAGTNLALTTVAGTDTLTITPSLTPAVTSLTATGNVQADMIVNREQRYTTSNVMRFNQMYTGASSGSYFTNGEYQKVVTITPDAASQNYQVLGTITAQNAAETHTVNFNAALRSNTLPALAWTIYYNEQYNGSRYIDPQLWTKQTTTAGFIFAFKTLGTIYGTVTVDITVIPRNSSQLSNVSVNTVQNSEQTSVDAGFTANDMEKVITEQGENVTIAGTLTGTTSSFTNTTTNDTLLLTTTEDSSSAGPVLTLKRNSASPADADYLGQLKFKGENDADQEVVYAKITGKIQDASDGSEDGLIEFANSKAGSNNINMRLRSDSLQLLNGTSLVVAGLTYPTSDGTNGQVLQTNGSGTLSFADASGGGATVSSDTTTNAERLIYVGSTTSGTLSAVTQDSGLTYNPSTGSLTSAAFIGDVTGNVTGSAATVTTAAQTNITSVGTLTSLGVTNNITVGGTVDGRDIATDGTKLDGIEASADVTDATNVTAAGAAMKANNLSDLPNASTARTNLGVAIGSNVQAYSSVLQNTTASFVTADETKLDYISVTQAVDLDQMETDIAALANGMVYKGNWDASAGSFPGSGSAQTGWFYYVSVAGTVDGISFAVGDNIVATTDNASTTTYAGNWSKHDQTDAVQAVVGLTGSIAKSSLLSALNVEDGADVTDSTNVTAAGALMDSEVDADIKTLSLPANTTISVYGATLVDDADAATARTTLGLGTAATTASTDYATAAQGTTADAALPKTGGAMTGAITTNSTFDGRDVATDGTKLDGIEASADVTDATNVAAAGALMTTGGSVTGNVSFGDNDKAIFGAGSDLQVYHDGSSSYLDDAGTGNLNLRSNGAGVIIADTSNTVLARFLNGNACDFNFNGSTKLATTATGIDVTGSITVSGTVDGRDVATDGTKLDGIAAGATNVTNNNQLTNGAGYTTNAGDITNVSVSGTGLSGGGASGSVTITSNATSANTASTIVARDGSGNFTAGVITGTATAARYADLAEKYTSDADYEPGTVVELGGEAEVTQSTGITSRRIAGIVSTNPAHLMNNELEADHVVDVALIGRVPCKVIGVFNKGDILISSNTHGHACAWTNATNPPAGSAIGKAIESKTDLGAGIIEVLVGRM